MIKFEHVSYTYPQTTQPALHNISLHIPEGEFALVVGMSGAGKSTLLRCINGLVPHFSGGTLRGNIMVNGLNPVHATPQILSQHVGFVFQDPESQFVVSQVEDEIAFALENIAMPAQEMRIRVEEVLDLLDLTSLRQRRLETLSGGEQQRVAIASVLALRPRILVLDEPTSQLDPKSADEVLQTLGRLNSDLGLTVVLVEHRLERVLPFVDSMIYLPDDSTEFISGTPHDVLPHLPLVPPLIELGRRLNWNPLPLTIKEGKRFVGQISIPDCAAGATPVMLCPDSKTSVVLTAHDVEIAYGQQSIVNGVSLTLQSHEIMVLMGRNGSGKSTLLKSFVGLIKPKHGQIHLHGEDISGHDVVDICRHVGYLPQDPNALLFADTVEDELLITLRNHGLERDNAAKKIAQQLEHLRLSDKASSYPRDLSAGERQRVALGAITITQPQILLLDEPTRGLDYEAKQILTTLLKKWALNGMAILLVTHDVELTAMIADRVLLMSQGEIIAHGSPTIVLGSSPFFAPQIARLFPNTGWLTVNDVLGCQSKL